MARGSKKVKYKNFFGPESPFKNLLPLFVGSLVAVMLLKYRKGLLLVAIDLSQLHTMASETVDEVDWPYPSPVTGQYSLRATFVPMRPLRV